MDISSLLSGLSQEDIEKLKATAQQFFGGKEETVKNEQPASVPPKNAQPELPFDPKLISSVARLSGMMNQTDDKSNFILALKPLLSEKRRKKADDAVMLLRFMKIVNSLQENTK